MTQHAEAPANVVREPSEVHVVFESLANVGDLEGLVALYEHEATLVPQPGHVVTGTPAIREALRQLSRWACAPIEDEECAHQHRPCAHVQPLGRNGRWRSDHRSDDG